MQQKMGLGGLGNTLSSKERGCFTSLRPRKDLRNYRGKYLVEMVEKQRRPLG